MPTGYTSPLYEGKDISFEDFAKRCAHAFIIDLRDEPADSAIPTEATVSPWKTTRVSKAQSELDEIKSWSKDRADQEASEWYESAIQSHERSMQKNAALLERYQSMLTRVRDWTIDTQLQGLKDFMIEQLESSIQFDTSYTPEMPSHRTGAEFKSMMIEIAQRSLDYAILDQEKEEARQASNQRWIDAFWKSLPENETEG